MGDMPVEALFPEGWKCFELGSAGWSRVLGIDAVGGPPHCNFADVGSIAVCVQISKLEQLVRAMFCAPGRNRTYDLHICLSAVDAQSVRYDKRDTSLKQICRTYDRQIRNRP